MDITVGAILGKIAEGLPIAVGLFLIIFAGYQGIWIFKRELDAREELHEKRFAEMKTACDARLADSQEACGEWKDIAKRTIGAAEKIVPAVVNAAVNVNPQKTGQ